MPNVTSILGVNNCEGLCITGNASCVEICPDDHSFIFQTPRSIHCLECCPNYTWEDKENKVCRLKCPTEKQFLFNKTCLDSCPKSHPLLQPMSSFYNTITLCSDSCLQDTLMDEGYCVSACPDGRYEFNNTCVRECPESHPLKNLNIRENPKTGRAKYTCVDSCNIETNSYISKKLKYKNHCVYGHVHQNPALPSTERVLQFVPRLSNTTSKMDLAKLNNALKNVLMTPFYQTKQTVDVSVHQMKILCITGPVIRNAQWRLSFIPYTNILLMLIATKNAPMVTRFLMRPSVHVSATRRQNMREMEHVSPTVRGIQSLYYTKLNATTVAMAMMSALPNIQQITS